MYPYFFETIGGIADYQSGEEWTVPDLKREVFARIAYYQKKGISSQDKVIIVHGNNARFFADLFALWHLNACGVCVDVNIGSTEFENITECCKSQFAICLDGIPEKLTDINCKHISFIDTLTVPTAEEFSKKTTRIPFPLNMDDPAIILFTSGTTGMPKGVVHTFRTLMAKWIILSENVPLEHMDVSLCLLPTNFGHGLICNCLFPLLSGKKLVVLPKFNLTVLAKLGNIIDEFSVTYMSSVPSVWKSALSISRPPEKGSLRLVTCGSAPLSADLWQKMQTWTGTKRIWNTYGITETGSWIAGTSVDEVEPKDGLIGPGWGTRILVSKNQEMADVKVDKLLEKNSLPVGEVGYVWLQTPTLMQGYLNRPDLTQSVVCGTWFYTGDLGYINEDGLLVLSGRVRNEINYGGIKVIPEDVDLILERHETIAESCTFGLADEMAGQMVAVAVVLKDDLEKPLTSELKQWSSQYLSDYKVPTVWYEVDAIPKTSRGKVNREDVAAFCQDRSKMK